MKIIDKIISFFEKILKKDKKETKMISAPKEIKEEKEEFINSLKVNIEEKRKSKVETLICYGDGLGIKGPMKY